MKSNTKAIHGMLAEMLNRLDRSNVGNWSNRKNQRNAESKAGGETRLRQRLS